jgi:hypothetical protein
VTEQRVGEDDIPPQVKAFLADTIDSVLQLEIVLLLRGRRGERWTADTVSREFRIDPAWTAGQMANLAAAGLFDRVHDPARGGGGGGGGAGAAYQYAPQNEALDEAVAATEQAYATRRVTVIALIHSRPPSPLRSFADAFRLRKDKPPEKPDKDRPDGR